MGKVAIEQISGNICYLPDKIPYRPKSTLAIFTLEDHCGNKGSCILVEDKCDTNSENGIFWIGRSFPKALLKCLNSDDTTFIFCQKRYRILSCDTELLTKRKQELIAQISKREAEEKKEIISYLINERRVKYLYHFTPYENLNGIAQYGIVQRAHLPEDAHAICLDESRYDNRDDFSCFSVSYPNYKMLYPLHQKRPYVIIEIDIKVLEIIDFKKMLFFGTNAANHFFRYSRPADFQGLGAVKKMFDLPLRSPDIPDCFTTDPQAEVMIGETVPTEYINALYFDQRDFKTNESVIIPNVFNGKAHWNQDIFFARSDYQCWQ